jgi:hypothetical protein
MRHACSSRDMVSRKDDGVIAPTPGRYKTE